MKTLVLALGLGVGVFTRVAEKPDIVFILADENPEKLKELRARYDVLAKEAVRPKISGPAPAGTK